jgi:MFS family permease
VIARDAESRVGSAYSWYSTAKHVGGVAGAAVAGVILSATDESYSTLFLVVLALSALPLLASWIGLREVESDDDLVAFAGPTGGRSRWAAATALARELSGPGSVAMLVTTSAYMVHGIFPILATEYAGLTAAQTGLIYSLSAAVVLVCGPLAGWLVDRHGPTGCIAWRSIANIGSSALYLASPTLPGIAVARAVDDSGKTAFRPAWAAAIARIAAEDPARRGQRLGSLDASQNAGEIVGPILAGALWQIGGVVALFGVRIVIAAAAELAALRVFRHERPPAPDTTPRSRRASPPPLDVDPQPYR